MSKKNIYKGSWWYNNKRKHPSVVIKSNNKDYFEIRLLSHDKYNGNDFVLKVSPNPNGYLCLSISNCSDDTLLSPSVIPVPATNPGRTQFARIPLGAISKAKTREKEIIPPFDAAYTELPISA